MKDRPEMKKKKSPASLLDPGALTALFNGSEISCPGFASPEIRHAAEIFCRAAERLKARITGGEEMGRGAHNAGDVASLALEEILGEMASSGLDLNRAAILEKNERRDEAASLRALREAENLMARIEAFSPKHMKGDARDEA